MSYKLKPTIFILKQLDFLEDKTLEILEEKFVLLKSNPGRFKEIVGFPYNLFRIRFYDHNKSKRLVYAIDKEYIKLLCIIDRDKNYKNLRRYLNTIKKNG